MIYEEQALYTTTPSPKSVLVPKFFQMILLCLLFYLGIVINLNLLRVDDETAFLVKIITIVLLVLLAIIQMILYATKLEKYVFYQDRIVKGKDVAYYRDMATISVKKGFLDKLFNTGTIVVSQGFELKHLSNYMQVYNYLLQLIQRSRFYF